MRTRLRHHRAQAGSGKIGTDTAAGAGGATNPVGPGLPIRSAASIESGDLMHTGTHWSQPAITGASLEQDMRSGVGTEGEQGSDRRRFCRTMPSTSMVLYFLS